MGGDLAVARHVLAHHVDVIEAAFVDREQRCVAGTAGLEGAEFGPLQGMGRVDGRGRHHIVEAHAEAQELRHRRDLLEGRPVDAQRMHVGGNGIGHEAVGEHGAGRLECERSLAVSDIEQDAAVARLAHGLLHGALGGGGRIRERAEGVREHVARAQARDHLLVARRRMIDMRHQRHTEFLGNLERHIERCRAGRAGRMHADAHLDADDDVAIGVRHAHRVRRCHQAHVLALADHDRVGERIDAGEGDVQVGEDAHARRLDDVLAEAREVAGAGTARIDRGRHAGDAAKLVGADAERRAAPVNVRVQIDQARGDDVFRGIAHDRLGASRQSRSHLGDLAGSEAHIAHHVELLRRVDDPAAFENEIEVHCAPRGEISAGSIRESRRAVIAGSRMQACPVPPPEHVFAPDRPDGAHTPKIRAFISKRMFV